MDEYEYYKGKATNRTYISKRIDVKRPIFTDGIVTEKVIPLRYASKVIDSNNFLEFVKEKGEIILRVTSEGRQEIKAIFLEDNRGISNLQIQKFTVETGSPHKTSFSFQGEEITQLYNFITDIKNIQIKNEDKFSISDNELDKLTLTKQQAYTIYKDNQDLFSEILNNNISQNDVKNLIYKKRQLEYFDNLLNDKLFFEEEKKKKYIKSDEAVWQSFFESNTWIFGYGLEYIINISLIDKKLEQVVSGYDVISKGKRVDAFMKSKGIINSLCFAEIKTPNSKLLSSEYRPAVYPPSSELSGGISQIQKTVKYSLENLINKILPTNSSGDPTGEEIYLYKPKSFLLIGSLNEFKSEFGTNKDKFSSFHLYRKSLKDIEIITFDELLERAKFIVHSDEIK